MKIVTRTCCFIVDNIPPISRKLGTRCPSARQLPILEKLSVCIFVQIVESPAYLALVTLTAPLADSSSDIEMDVREIITSGKTAISFCTSNHPLELFLPFVAVSAQTPTNTFGSL